MAKTKRTEKDEPQEAARKERASATGHVGLEEVPVGTKLHRVYKGERFDFEVFGDKDKGTLIRMVKPRREGPWSSLSKAAEAVSGHAERGSTVLRTEDGKPLLAPPRYEARAATPGPTATKKAGAGSPKRKATGAKPKRGNGKGGTVKRSWQCGICKAKLPTQKDVTDHIAKEHPAS